MTGCSSEPLSLPPPDSPVITLRGWDNPPSLDPAKVSGTFDGHLACLLHAGLVRSDPDGGILPELAQEWEVSEDGTSVRFLLKEGLQFPSGKGFTAEDVLYSYKRVCRPETASPNAWVFENLLGYEEFRSDSTNSLPGIEVKSSTTIVFHLSRPDATFLARLTMPAARIVDRSKVEELGSSYGRHPVGLGAWRLVDWEDDSHLLLEPNPLYPGRNTDLEGLRFQLVPKDFTAGALFETGGLHVLDPLPLSQSPKWEDSALWSPLIRTSKQYNLYYIGFGCHRPPLDNPEVRKAIRRCIHVDRIRKVLFQDRAVPAYGPIPPGLLGNLPSPPSWLNEDQDEAGLPEGLELELWFREGDSTLSLAMEAVQADLQSVGVSCRLRKVDRTTYIAWRREGKFDLFLGDWWADYPDPDNFMTPLFGSDSASKMTGFASPSVDRLLKKAAETVPPNERETLYHQASKEIYQGAPMIFLWHRHNKVITQPWVHGYQSPPLFQGTLHLDLRLEE